MVDVEGSSCIKFEHTDLARDIFPSGILDEAYMKHVVGYGFENDHVLRSSSREAIESK